MKDCFKEGRELCAGGEGVPILPSACLNVAGLNGFLLTSILEAE